MKRQGSQNASLKKTKKTSQSYRVTVRGLLTLFVVVCLGLAGWAGWEYWQGHHIRAAQETVNAKYKNIKFESDTFQNESLFAHATYVVSENEHVNKDIRNVVDVNFMPCKETGQQNKTALVYECNASPNIDFATDQYLEVTYSFREYPDHLATKDVKVRRVSLLYDRKAGKRLNIGDLFKPDVQFAQTLSSLVRQELQKRFEAAYYSKGTFRKRMQHATEPNPIHFHNFILTGNEKLIITYEPGTVAPATEGVIEVELSTDSLYDLFNQTTIDVFLPKLKEQKEAEARLAKQAEEARRRAQQLVGENRENIDCSKMKCIALTYDDGPYAPNGNRLLDVLSQRNAVATFFMIGNRVGPYAPELKRAVSLKNEIGNHSWDHSNLTNLSDGAVANQVQQTNQAIYNASGVYPKLMRPPYGAVDARTMAQINMPIALWNVDTLDWRDRDPNLVHQRAIAGAKPGAVILMHEIHATTVDAAAQIVDELQRQGYVLVTVSELFGINKDNLAEFTNKKLFQREY